METFPVYKKFFSVELNSFDVVAICVMKEVLLIPIDKNPPGTFDSSFDVFDNIEQKLFLTVHIHRYITPIDLCDLVVFSYYSIAISGFAINA